MFTVDRRLQDLILCDPENIDVLDAGFRQFLHAPNTDANEITACALLSRNERAGILWEIRANETARPAHARQSSPGAAL